MIFVSVILFGMIYEIALVNGIMNETLCDTLKRQIEMDQMMGIHQRAEMSHH